ncbi:hypothetical protein STEG23_032221 [Scotinomys teguina]
MYIEGLVQTYAGPRACTQKTSCRPMRDPEHAHRRPRADLCGTQSMYTEGLMQTYAGPRAYTQKISCRPMRDPEHTQRRPRADLCGTHTCHFILSESSEPYFADSVDHFLLVPSTNSDFYNPSSPSSAEFPNLREEG